MSGTPQDDYAVTIVGDFNLPPEDPAWSALRAVGLVPTIVAPKKTTIGDVSLYDNWWLPASLVARTPGGKAIGTVYPFETVWLPPESNDVARRAISDHRVRAHNDRFFFLSCLCGILTIFLYKSISIEFEVDAATWQSGTVPSLPALNVCVRTKCSAKKKICKKCMNSTTTNNNIFA